MFPAVPAGRITGAGFLVGFDDAGWGLPLTQYTCAQAGLTGAVTLWTLLLRFFLRLVIWQVSLQAGWVALALGAGFGAGAAAPSNTWPVVSVPLSGLASAYAYRLAWATGFGVNVNVSRVSKVARSGLYQRAAALTCLVSGSV